jgi:octaprenyl-diphosphate synthase
VRRSIRSSKKRSAAAADIQRFVRNHGGLDYARAAMEEHAAAAADTIRAFPPSEARDALIELSAYIVARRS